MDLTPLHQRGAPECLGHGRVEGLRAIDDHQQAPVGAQPAAGEISQEPLTDRLYRLRVLGQWFDGIRFYAAASSPRRSRRTWAGLR